jgi:hypothetical protein
MSLFVAHRFSAGISALTMRYHQWERYADAIEFKRIELLGDEPMWVFARHPHNTTRGQAHKALSVDAAMAQALAQPIRLRKLTRCGPVRAASHPQPPTPGPPRSFVMSTTVSSASRRSIARSMRWSVLPTTAQR